jgi:MFS family permease
MAMIAIMFMDPMLTVYLTSLGMSEANAGLVFMAAGASFGFGGPISGYLCNYIPRNVIILIGTLLVALSILLMGPSQMLGLPP